MPNQNKVIIDIRSRTIVRIILVILGFSALLYSMYLAKSAIIILFASAFLAIAVSPPVNWLSERVPGKSRALATAISYVTVLIVISSLLYSFVPTLINQTEQFIDNSPGFIADISSGDNEISRIIKKYKLTNSLDEIQGEVTSKLSKSGGPILSFIGSIFTNVAVVLTVIVLTFFMLVEGPAWIVRFWDLFPPDNRSHHKKMAAKMYHVVTGFVNGQIFIGTIAAVSSFVVMTILGVEYALPLAVFVGIFDVIPMIGATIGSVIAAGGSLLTSVSAAVIMLIYFVIYQQIENNVIQPFVQSKTVDISPLLILVAALAGVYVAGLLGAIVAIPIAACLKIFVKDYIYHNIIEKRKNDEAKKVS